MQSPCINALVIIYRMFLFWHAGTGAFGDPNMFRCAGGMGFVTIDHLCDGNGDCPNGNDETIALCASECICMSY